MRLYQHIIFWAAVYGSLTLVFADWFGGHTEAFYYVSLLMPVVMGTSYFFNFYLVPRFLFTRKFFLFGLYSLYLLVVSLCLELMAGIVAMLLIIYYGISQHAAIVTDVFTLAVILYFIVLFKSFLLLIKHYFIDQHAIRELEKKQEKADAGYLNIRSDRRSSRLYFDHILYIESMADYILIHLEHGEEVRSKMKISHLERELPVNFVRIHRSFIVNKAKVTSYSRESLELGGKELPISRTYKNKALEALGQPAGNLASS